jgi:vancomycin resistance protein YoaR
VRSKNKVLPTVTVLGQPLAGLDEGAATRAVEALSPKVSRLVGHVRVKERTFELTAGSVGAVLDVQETVRRALAAGRSGPWVRQFAAFVARPFTGTMVPVALRLAPTQVETTLATFERAALGDPELEGAVTYTDRLVRTYPREGLGIVREQAHGLLEHSLLPANRGEVVVLPIEPRRPRLTAADVDSAAAAAERMLAGPVLLRSPAGAELAFTSADLGHALRNRVVLEPHVHLDVFLEPSALLEVVQRARSTLERPPRDATFRVGPTHDVSVVPSELGTRLDGDAILAVVLQLAGGTAREGELVIREDVTPALTTEQAEALQIRGFVSGYTTPFPCCEARIKNIERIAALVDGSIVRPGDVYSINERTGPRIAANGFVAGPTIVEGEMDYTIGGGVSQFATTLFNAAFDGGYEIIQRQPHTYWFPRYPEGYDATLGFPLPDLVFRNDSSAGILIKTAVGKTSVRVELYGDNGGRRVARHVSPRFDIVKPELVLEPNPSLRPDETKVQYGGSIGWSLNVSRVVTFADGQQKEEHRKVTYSPRARRVETHPCKIPEGAPGHTGERCPIVEGPDGGA